MSIKTNIMLLSKILRCLAQQGVNQEEAKIQLTRKHKQTLTPRFIEIRNFCKLVQIILIKGAILKFI